MKHLPLSVAAILALAGCGGGTKVDAPSDEAISLVVYEFDQMGEYPLDYVRTGGDFESGYELTDSDGNRLRLKVMRRGTTRGDYRARFMAETPAANSAYPLSSALPFALCMNFSGNLPPNFTYRCSKSGQFQGVFPD